METYEHVGTYPIRTISKGESIIHMPNIATGSFSIYKNEDATCFVLRKELPFKTEKFMRDMDKIAEDGKFIDWKDAEKALGLEVK
jgi:hypothetical protein